MNRPILLTGSAGQIGTPLRERLSELGTVIAPTRGELDLADLSSIARAIEDNRPSIIVNAAAYTAVDQAESDPNAADLVNHKAVRALGEAAARYDASIIHYSTDYVFDGGSSSPYRPDAHTNPLSVYGRTKRDGEEALLASGADCLILRTSWVYSTRGANFLLTMLRLAAERDELRIVDDQVGAPTWADWIADATTGMLRGRLERHPTRPFEGVGSVYHLTCAGQTTWCRFARAIFDRAELEQVPHVIGIPTDAYPTPATRPKYSVLDCSLTEEDFGITRPTWEAALDDALHSV